MSSDYLTDKCSNDAVYKQSQQQIATPYQNLLLLYMKNLTPGKNKTLISMLKMSASWDLNIPEWILGSF